MDIRSFFANIAFVIYLSTGIYILLIGRKILLNRLFFITCILLSAWAFMATFLYSATVPEFTHAYFQIAWLSCLLFYAAGLHFFLEFTGIVRPGTYTWPFLYLPGIILFIKHLESPIFYNKLIEINSTWINYAYSIDTASAWYYIFVVYAHIYLLIGLIVITISYSKTNFKKKKKQSLIILISLILTYIPISLDSVFIPGFTSYNSLGLSPIFFLIWISGTVYSMVRYRFLSITPGRVSNDIVANIDDSIILLNSELEILTINNKTAQLVNRSDSDCAGQSIEDIFIEYDIFLKEFDKLAEGTLRYFSCRLHYRKSGGSDVLVDNRVSLIKDDLGDVIGVLICGKEVKELKELCSIYQITEREMDVIRSIMMGNTTREMAQNLGIAERTIKTHITNIYQKLNVNNKVQLLNLLKSLHIMN